MKSGEKRRAPRARHDSVVEIFDAGGNVLIGTARLIDFSNVGVSITGSLNLAKGSLVHARVRMLEEGILDVIGCVVWVRPRPSGRQYGISIQSKRRIPR